MLSKLNTRCSRGSRFQLKSEDAYVYAHIHLKETMLKNTLIDHLVEKGVTRQCKNNFATYTCNIHVSEAIKDRFPEMRVVFPNSIFTTNPVPKIRLMLGGPAPGDKESDAAESVPL